MFGNILGDMQKKQEELQNQLAQVEITAEAGGGAIKVTANALREILNISIDKSKLDWEDQEEVEDLLLTAVNRVLEQAADKEAAASQNLMGSLLPPGMEGLF